MGYLRTYLALCVVVAHSNAVFPWASHDGIQAVQIFFCISGFYMAMILSNRYESAKEFYVSRWLRIFGPYYLALVAIVLWSTLFGLRYGNWLSLSAYRYHPLESNGLAGVLVTAASNFTVFFQDWIMFLKHDRGAALGFTADFATSRSPLYQYLVMRQGWSIGVEETFYLLAPFVNKLRTRAVLLLLAASLLARIYAYSRLGLQHDPFTYRFFPFESAMFLMGVLGWRAYVRFDLEHRFPSCPDGFAYPFACVLLAAGLYLHAAVVEEVSKWLGRDYTLLLSYPLWTVTVVFLFAYFRRHRVDRFVGELCFPVYLLHVAVILTVASLSPHFRIAPEYLGRVSALATLSVSTFLLVFVLRPYDRWRHAYILKRRAADGTLPRGKTEAGSLAADPLISLELRPLQTPIDVRRDNHWLDPVEGSAALLAPSEKRADGSHVREPRVGVSDVGGEEL